MAMCVLHESEDLTWHMKDVTLSAPPADPGLNVVTAAAATETAAAHPGAAPPISEHSH
jgi:hypothetical protein